jgi:hypothetical protein
MNLTTKYLTENPCYKSGRKITVKGLMLHSVGCSQPNPMVFINNWNRANYGNACVHGFIGEDEVFLTLPCMETPGQAHRGWHGASGVNGSCNNTHIGVEMCEPSTIKYVGGASFTCSDKTAAIAYVEKTTHNAVELFATLCAFHGLDPLADGVIISHAEGCKRGIASNHGDPDHLWRGLGMDYNMDKFRSDVAAFMKGEETVTQEQFDTMLENWLNRQEDKAPADWSAAQREWAESNGIIAGDGTGKKMYRAFCTREQMVVFLNRIVEKFCK